MTATYNKAEKLIIIDLQEITERQFFFGAGASSIAAEIVRSALSNSVQSTKALIYSSSWSDALEDFFNPVSKSDYHAATETIANGREETFSSAGDQARFEKIGEAVLDEIFKVQASCVKPDETPLTADEKAKKLSDAAYAATHACAFMDYKI
jgi:hypothetical protein